MTIIVRCVVAALIAAMPAWLGAEDRLLKATGEYRMGDNDTRADAKRLALQDAKRLALEKAGTFLESIVEIKNADVTRDEIRTYAAGIIEVVEQGTHTALEGDTTVVRVDVTAKIDTAVVAKQIEALRRNESVRGDLVKLRAEMEQLRKEVAEKTRQLGETRSKAEATRLVEERQQGMNGLEANELVAQAKVLMGYEAGDFNLGRSTSQSRAQAKALLVQAAKLAPQDEDVQSTLFAIYLDEGRHQEALKIAEDAMRMAPDKQGQSAGYHMMGVVFLVMTDFPRAQQAFLKSIELDGSVRGPYEHLAEIAFLSGDMAGVVKWLRVGTSRVPSDSKLHAKLADMLFENGGPGAAPEALREAQIAVQLDPRSADAHRVFGKCLIVNQQWRDGVFQLQEAIRLDPGSHLAYEDLGRGYGYLGRLPEAAGMLRESLRRVPNTALHGRDRRKIQEELAGTEAECYRRRIAC
jgi:tetratricopeptide (TPR) repeat protein